MSNLNEELIFLILQFLGEEKYTETLHKFERESAVYFNLNHFDDMIMNGDLDDAEDYLKGFTKTDENRFSMKCFFEIRKQKYLEALDNGQHAKAVDILSKELKAFSSFNEELYKDMAVLLTLQDFREHEQLTRYVDAKSARVVMLAEIKRLLESNPVFHEKLEFPDMMKSRLRALFNQSLNWQHQLCRKPRANPDIKTLYEDHVCLQQNNAEPQIPAPNPLSGLMPRLSGFPFPPMNAPSMSQNTSVPLPSSFAPWMASPTLAFSQTGHTRPFGLVVGDNNTADSESMPKRSRSRNIPEEANVPPMIYTGQSSTTSSYSMEDLPKHVVKCFDQGSAVKCLDFHPVTETLLLVGTTTGEISAWEIGIGKRLCFRKFSVWDLGACSMTLQASLANDDTVFVNRIKWSPEGKLVGVAYSKHIVQLFVYDGTDDFKNHFELDAHVGSVSDLAFSCLNNRLCVVTCGEDKKIKVWNASNGARQYTFEGHAAPVYSVCPHSKNNTPYIFSTSIDGKIKAWLYENANARIDYDTPLRVCSVLAYSADGTRLFSCGMGEGGESFIVEWNDSKGSVIRNYLGLLKQSVGMIQFDTTMNRFLVAGDDFSVKFWDVDDVNLLTTLRIDGLPACPYVRFSKEGRLLAVSANDNRVKILANNDGLRLFSSIEPQSASKSPVFGPFGLSNSMAGISIGIKVKLSEAQEFKPKPWRVTEINEASQLSALKVPDNALPVRIIRLIYTNSGNGIITLSYNAIHKLWKWQKTDRNVTGKATTAVPPQLWHPASGILMTNDLSHTNLEEAIPCFALSRNDAYLISASGGKISLFNTNSFKTMACIMAPPPAATCIAYQPDDNNVVAVGMEDASILIYNVRLDEVNFKLRGHQKRVTGLAFSKVLNVLVSSGADYQVCVWSMDGWDKKASVFLQFPPGRVPNSRSLIKVQFHRDRTHVLVVHETQIAVYRAPKLECIKQWFPADTSSLIADATYSCNGQSIYVAFQNCSICVLSATRLKLKCRINPPSYIPPGNQSLTSLTRPVYPMAITAHPSKANQFALGFSDGAVYVLEPTKSEGKWGDEPPPLNNVASSRNVAATAAMG